MDYRRVKVFVNPVAGSGLGREAMDILSREVGKYANHLIEVTETLQHGSLDLIHKISGNYDLLVFVGGDTTANIAGIASSLFHDRLPHFALIPIGTENDLATSQGNSIRLNRRNIHRVLPSLFASLLKGKAKRIIADTVSIGSEVRLVGTSAIGFDANVSCAFARFRKTSLGRLILRRRFIAEAVYFMIALSHILARDRLHEIVALVRSPDGHRMVPLDLKRGVLSIQVTNGRFYGGATISKAACPDDGYFEVTVVRSIVDLATIFLNRYFTGMVDRLDRIEQHRVDRFEIFPMPGALHFHVDGDDFTSSLSSANQLIYQVSDPLDLHIVTELRDTTKEATDESIRN